MSHTRSSIPSILERRTAGLLFPLCALGFASTADARDLFVGSSNTAILKGSATSGDFQFVSACGGAVNSMAMFGSTVHVGDSQGNIYVYDDTAQSIAYAFTLPTTANAMVRSAAHVVVGGDDGKIFVAHPSTGALAATHDVFASVDALALSGTTLVAGSLAPGVFLGDVNTGNFFNLLGCGGCGPIQSAAQDGELLFLGDNTGNIYTYDLDLGFVSYAFTVQSDLTAMAVDGAALLVGSSSGTILRIDRSNGAVLGTFQVGMPIEAMAIAPIAEPGTGYCFGVFCPCGNDDATAGCANSTGRGALVLGSGSASVGADDMKLTVLNLPPGVLARFYMSDVQGQIPFADGFLCAGGGGYPAFRFPLNHASLGGVMEQGPGIVEHVRTHLGVTIAPGATWNFQVWYRNVLGPCGTFLNVSSAYEVKFAP